MVVRPSDGFPAITLSPFGRVEARAIHRSGFLLLRTHTGSFPEPSAADCVELTSAKASGRTPDGRLKVTHSNLKIEVRDPYILVAMRGTCLRAKYRKQDAPWLAPEEYGEDPEAAITFSEFRTLAWEVANEAARQLGWIRTCNELHEAAKMAASAI
jgi:hypothetical protein